MITIREVCFGGKYDCPGYVCRSDQPVKRFYEVRQYGRRIDSFLTLKNAKVCAKRLGGLVTVERNNLAAYKPNTFKNMQNKK